MDANTSTISFETKHVVVRSFEVAMENIVLAKNNRLTAEWNVLLLAKNILESGGWLQSDPFYFKLLSMEDWEKYVTFTSQELFKSHS